MQQPIPVLDIWRLDARLLPLDDEAELLQQHHDLLVGELKAARIRDARRPVGIVHAVAVVIVPMVPRRIILKVPQQRTDVDEQAPGLQARADHLEVPDEIRRRVEEEDARDGVVRALVLLVAVRAQEVGGAHGHGPGAGRAPEHRRRVHVRDRVAAQVVGAREVVGEGVNPGVDGVLAGAAALVEDVLRGEELVVGDLVALGVEAVLAELVDETAEPGARHENGHDLLFSSLRPAAPCCCCCCSPPPPLRAQGLQHGPVAALALVGAVGRPVAPELADGAARLVDVRVARHAGVGRRDGLAAKRAQGEVDNVPGKRRVGVDGGVGGVERSEVVEGRRGEELPVVLGEGVEGLAAEVRHVEVRDSCVFAAGGHGGSVKGSLML